VRTPTLAAAGIKLIFKRSKIDQTHLKWHRGKQSARLPAAKSVPAI
jgi:hypothetical protein